MFKKLSRKIGFTVTELKVILFLIAAFAIGFFTKSFLKKEEVSDYKDFDYSKEDSVFSLSTNDESLNQETNLNDKKVDYKQEVLDFNKSNFQRHESKVLPKEKSININTADFNDLIMLPGIGEKTAEKILDFRKENIRFEKLEDLIKVKGIGNSKFKNIKKYIYIK